MIERQRTDVWVFEADVGFVGINCTRQGGLASLARTGNRDDGVITGEFGETGGGGAWNHGRTLAPMLRIGNSIDNPQLPCCRRRLSPGWLPKISLGNWYRDYLQRLSKGICLIT